MKILIVDDSELDRRLLVRILQKAEIKNEILQATDGEDGLHTLASNYKDICVVLLDWQMPKMNGIEVLEGIVKVPAVSDVPVIMVTASGSEENKKLAYSVNPRLAGYIVKPYKPDQMVEAIKPFLK
ncbi:MAG: response regulator [Candidatus Omnitrophica bacterium]|nr:response regulator [Candidatus Omnitrophota bacterium]